MTRFTSNRRWTFILTLGVSLLLSPFVAHTVRAGSGPSGGILPDPNDPNGGGGVNVGDPDVPIGPSKTMKSGGLSRGSGTYLGTRTAGDGGSTGSVLMWRLRVALQGLRSFYIRF